VNGERNQGVYRDSKLAIVTLFGGYYCVTSANTSNIDIFQGARGLAVLVHHRAISD